MGVEALGDQIALLKVLKAADPQILVPSVEDKKKLVEGPEAWEKAYQLHKGRMGEAVIEMKATGIERLIIVVALLLSVTWSLIKNLNDLSDHFRHKASYTIYQLGVVLSNSAGIFSLLLLVFVSIRIRRNVASSLFVFGNQSFQHSYSTLLRIHNKQMIDDALQETNLESAAGIKNMNDTHFSARKWYNETKPGKWYINGRRLYGLGLLSFVGQLVFFAIAASIKLADTSDLSKATMSYFLALNMIWPPGIALLLLHSAKVFNDLL